MRVYCNNIIIIGTCARLCRAVDLFIRCWFVPIPIPLPVRSSPRDVCFTISRCTYTSRMHREIFVFLRPDHATDCLERNTRSRLIKV